VSARDFNPNLPLTQRQNQGILTMNGWPGSLLLPALLGALVGGVLLLVTNSAGERSHDGYADAVKLAAPSVVSIYSSRTMQPALCKLPRYQAWCEKLENSGAARVDSSLGSGVIVRADGHIVTNNHVIEDADEVLVGLNSGTVLPATVIGRDRDFDLAVIRVQAKNAPPIKISSSENVHVGDIALAIGNPFGIGQTVSQGIIGAVSRVVIGESTYDNFMQTDAAINPGNSGGALVNSDGELIGINTMIFSRDAGSQGIGFAIPSDVVEYVLEEILAHGRVRRGWIGIELAEQRAGSTEFGFRIIGVDAGGPGELGGLKIGDTLMALDNQMPRDRLSISRQVGMRKPGARMQITVDRNGQMIDLVLVVAERPEPAAED